MLYTEVADMVESFGLPWAYRTFSQATKKAPPYVVYYYTGNDDMFADNINYQEIVGLRIELYTVNKEFGIERTLETILKQNEIAYSKDESYIDDQNMYMIVYESEVVING